MSTDTDSSTGNSSTETETEDDYEWEVSGDGMTLRKVSYSTYEIEHNGVIVSFGDVRERENGAYKLRNSNSRTIGQFDPRAVGVPDEIASAFQILAAEL